jgi:hypothetical protein
MERSESNIVLLERILNNIGIQIVDSDGNARQFIDVVIEIQEKFLLIDAFTRDMLFYALVGAIDYSRVYKASNG